MLHKQQGIGLIEVMIAAVVFALGSIAIIQLQGKFFQSSNAALGRSVAMSIAEEKLEDLRNFENFDDTDADIFDFTSITSNAGGNCTEVNDDDTCTLEFAATNQAQTISVNNLLFSRDWTVTDYYYNSAGALSTAISGNIAQKVIEVTIAWIDTDGSPQDLTLATVINSNSTSSGGVIVSNAGGSGESPKVPHIELPAPDVMKPSIKSSPSENYDGTTAEWDALSDTARADSYANYNMCNVETFGSTEAPDPDLNTNPTLDNVLVRFTSTTYQTYTPCTFNSSGNYTIPDSNNVIKEKVNQSEFLTINCSCTLASSASGDDPSGTSVTKALTATKTGATNQQSDFCNLCCEDHHENTTGDYVCSSGTNVELCYDPYRSGSDYHGSGDHNHYLDSDLSTAVAVGDEYSEVCRIKRVDGFYNVIQDWKMIAHNLMVENELVDASEASSYNAYIGTAVNAYLDTSGTYRSTANVSDWTATSPDVPTDGTQMMSRSIYVDYMTDAEITTISTTGTDIHIDVPFYEYKATQLSDWSTSSLLATDVQTVSPCDEDSSSVNACTDSPTITAIVNNNSLDKGIFRYNGSVSGDIDIVSEMAESNSGVVSESAIDPADNVILDDSYTVVFGAGPPAAVRSVEMSTIETIGCPATWKVGPTTYGLDTENIADWSAISLSCSPSSGNAATCESYASDTNNISVTVAMNTAALSCSYANGITYACGTVSGLSGGSRLDVTGTYACSIESSKSGSSLGCQLVCE